MRKSNAVNENRIIPTRLAYARNFRKLSQVEVLNKINELSNSDLKQSIYSQWETGRRTIAIKHNAVIAEALNTSLEYLTGLTDNINSIYGDLEIKTIDIDEEDSKIKIDASELYRYDKKPLFVVPLDYSFSAGWGIFDKLTNTVTTLNGIIKLTKDSDLEFYVYGPSFINEIGIRTKRRIDLRTVFECDYIYLESCSPDRVLRAQINGYYHHLTNGNNDKIALVSETGIILPYSGINISYIAYDVGFAKNNP